MLSIDIQRIIDSSFGVRLAYFMGRALPVRLGHTIADFLGEQIASHWSSKMVQAVRANQWVVHGGCLGKEGLDQVVRETFRHSACSIFDLYHYIDNPKAANRSIVPDSTTRQLVQRPEFDDRGLMLVGLHLSNFDLVLQWLIREGMKAMVLTIQNPQGGRRMEFEIRKKSGMHLVPASMVTLRQALRHLQQGGVVLTGIDRPIPDQKTFPRFFGLPATLPTHHIFLAAKARVPVMIMATNLLPDGKYHVLTSDLIEMETHPDREIEALQNAEKVLGIAEGFIKKVPQQWSVSLPVWPDILDQVPN